MSDLVQTIASKKFPNTCCRSRRATGYNLIGSPIKWTEAGTMRHRLLLDKHPKTIEETKDRAWKETGAMKGKTRWRAPILMTASTICNLGTMLNRTRCRILAPLANRWNLLTPYRWRISLNKGPSTVDSALSRKLLGHLLFLHRSNLELKASYPSVSKTSMRCIKS